MKLLQISILAGIMIIAIIAIRKFTINRLPKKIFLILWILVLLWLLFPFTLMSQLTNHSTSVAKTLSASTSQSEVSTKTNIIKSIPISPYFIIWIIGAILCILYFIISYFKNYYDFLKSLPNNSSFAVAHKSKKRIEIQQSGRIKTFLTYCFTKPSIMLPKDMNWTDIKHVQLILQQENVNIYRFNLVIKILLTIALCIHWFNPLVWIMYILANRDIELLSN